MFNKKFGFSLAEALIMLLIVSLVVAASLPVLTKKNRSISYKGKYECFAKSPGNYYSRTTIDGVVGPLKQEIFGCVFTPPAKAKNFKVTIVGGGGGGASGTSGASTEIDLSDSGFTVPKTAKYNLEMQGGSGTGGDMECGNPKTVYNQYGIGSSIPSIFYSTIPSDIEKRLVSSDEFDSAGVSYDVVGYELKSADKDFYQNLLKNNNNDDSYLADEFRQKEVCYSEKDWLQYTSNTYKADNNSINKLFDKCWNMPAQAGASGQVVSKLLTLQKNSIVTYTEGAASDYITHKNGYKSCISINGKPLCAAGGKPGYSRIIQNIRYKNVPLKKLYYKYLPRCESNFYYNYANSTEVCSSGYTKYYDSSYGYNRCRQRAYDDDYDDFACFSAGWNSCAETRPNPSDPDGPPTCIGKCTSDFKYYTGSTYQECPSGYDRYLYSSKTNDCRKRVISDDFDLSACMGSGVNHYYYNSSSIVATKNITYTKPAFSVPACINSERNSGHPYYDYKKSYILDFAQDYKADRPYDVDAYDEESTPDFQIGGWGAGVNEFIMKFEEFIVDGLIDATEEIDLFKGGNGEPGWVRLRNATFAGGGGGKSGQVVYMNEQKLPKLIIRIGTGGSGGSGSAQDGYIGGNTIVIGGNINAVAKGGKGGLKNTNYDTNGKAYAPGENGAFSPAGIADTFNRVVTPYGGYAGKDSIFGYKYIYGFSIPTNYTYSDADYPYGAGGGGGAGESYSRGNGGSGAAGVVIIEW